MEAYEATRIVYSRVQAVDPDNVSKIMGYLLLQDQGEHQIFSLATASDSLLQSAVARARMQLGLLGVASQMPNFGPAACKLQALAPVDVQPSSFQKQQEQLQRSSFSGGMFPNDHFYPETFAFLNSSKIKAETSGAAWPLDSEAGSDGSCCSFRPCVFYSRGVCKNRKSSCCFAHNDSCYEGEQQHDQSETTGSLDRLDRELQELLSTRTSPVSIAALPQLYYERFGRPLQAEGYLTESQRHGKSGYNLTRLLSKLKDSITLIDRPHGQHAVVLAEDAHKFSTFPCEHYDLSGVNPSSRQIYLTFPADSSFSEDDVNLHFRAYGPVQDVRIPYQQKRMFGFVTFVYPETVKIVLSEGNPHYICGARVLVKPYRERGKHGERCERKHLDKSESPKYGDYAIRDGNHEMLKFNTNFIHIEDGSVNGNSSSHKDVSLDLLLPDSDERNRNRCSDSMSFVAIDTK